MGGILSGPRPPPDLALCAEATVCPDNPAPAAGAGGAGGGRQPCDSCQSCGRKSWHPTLGPRSRLAQPEAGGGRRPMACGKVGTHVLLLVPKAALQAQRADEGTDPESVGPRGGGCGRGRGCLVHSRGHRPPEPSGSGAQRGGARICVAHKSRCWRRPREPTCDGQALCSAPPMLAAWEVPGGLSQSRGPARGPGDGEGQRRAGGRRRDRHAGQPEVAMGVSPGCWGRPGPAPRQHLVPAAPLPGGLCRTQAAPHPQRGACGPQAAWCSSQGHTPPCRT